MIRLAKKMHGKQCKLCLNVMFAIICLVSFQGRGQNYKFGKVSTKELQETKNSDFPKANATILYSNTEIKIEYQQGKGFVQNKYVHKRIKIYNTAGLEFAKQSIDLFKGNSNVQDKLFGLKGAAYQLNKGKVIKTKLLKKEVQKETVSANLQAIFFEFPEVKIGSVIEFKYIIKTPYFGISDVILQEVIPIKKLYFKLEVPNYFKYGLKLNPYSNTTPTIKTSLKNVYVNYTSNFSDYLIYKFTKVSVINVPPLINERFIDNIWNYQAKLMFELKAINWPNNKKEDFTLTWETQIKKITSNVKFIKSLTNTAHYKNDVDAIINKKNSPTKRIYNLFKYLKTKLSWNNRLGCIPENDVKFTFKNGKGNIADINLILVSVLRYAKFDAFPVLLNTVDLGIPLLASRMNFNYLVCGIKLNNTIIYLDASCLYCGINQLPESAINWFGAAVKKNNEIEWLNLEPQTPSQLVTLLNTELIENQFVTKGRVKQKLTNNLALRFRAENYHKTEAQLQEDLKYAFDNSVTITNSKIFNLQQVDKAVFKSYDFEQENAVKVKGNTLYFNPKFCFNFNDDAFKNTYRNSAINFVFPFEETYIIAIAIPKGYIIDKIPKPLKINFNDGVGQFKYLTKISKNKIQLIISLKINQSIIMQNQYSEFKKFYTLVLNKEKENIILKK